MLNLQNYRNIDIIHLFQCRSLERLAIQIKRDQLHMMHEFDNIRQVILNLDDDHDEKNENKTYKERLDETCLAIADCLPPQASLTYTISSTFV